MRNSKVIFIGAGVGNLLAANYLLRHGVKDFVILEKGKDLKQRSCPCSEKYHCQNCSICSVTDGVGGANALNGNKICHFPASSGVVDFVGEDMVKPALNFQVLSAKNIMKGNRAKIILSIISQIF